MPYETRSRTGKKPPPNEIQFGTHVPSTVAAAGKKTRPRNQSKTEETQPKVKKGKSTSKKKSKTTSKSKASTSTKSSSGSAKSSSGSSLLSNPVNQHLDALTETEEDEEVNTASSENELLLQRAQYGKFHEFLHTLATSNVHSDLKSMYSKTLQRTQERLKEQLKLKEQEKSDPQAAVAQTPLGKKLMSVKQFRPAGTKHANHVAVGSTIEEVSLEDSCTSESSVATASTVSSNPAWPKTPVRKHRKLKARKSFLVVKSPWAKQRVTRGAAKKLAAKKEKEQQIADTIEKELRDDRRSPSPSHSNKKQETEPEDDVVMKAPSKENREKRKMEGAKRKVEVTVDIDAVSGVPEDFYLGRELCPSTKKRRMEKFQHQDACEHIRSARDPPTATTSTIAKTSKFKRPPLPPKKTEKEKNTFSDDLRNVPSIASTSEAVLSVPAPISMSMSQPQALTQSKITDRIENSSSSCSNSRANPECEDKDASHKHDQQSKSSAVLPQTQAEKKTLSSESNVTAATESKASKPASFGKGELNPVVLVERMDIRSIPSIPSTTNNNVAEVIDITDAESTKSSVKSSKSGAPSKKKKKKLTTTDNEFNNADKDNDTIKNTQSKSESGKISSASTSSLVSSSSSRSQNTINTEEFKIPPIPVNTVSKTKVEKKSSTSNKSRKGSAHTLPEQEQKVQEIHQKQQELQESKLSSVSDTTVTIESKIEANKTASSLLIPIFIEASVGNETFVVPKQHKLTKKESNSSIKESSNELKSGCGSGSGFTTGDTTFVVPQKGREQETVSKSKGIGKLMEDEAEDKVNELQMPKAVPDLSATYIMHNKNEKGILQVLKRDVQHNHNQNETFVVGNSGNATFNIDTPPRSHISSESVPKANANVNVPALISEEQQLPPSKTITNAGMGAGLLPVKLARHGSSEDKQSKAIVAVSSGVSNDPKNLNDKKVFTFETKSKPKVTKTVSSSSSNSSESTTTGSTYFSSASSLTPKNSVQKLTVGKKLSPPKEKTQAGQQLQVSQGHGTLPKKLGTTNADVKIKTAVAVASSSKTASTSSSASSSTESTISAASTVASASASVPRTPPKKAAYKEKVVQEGHGFGSGSSHAKLVVHSAGDLDIKKKQEEYQRLIEKQEESQRKKDLIIQQKKEMQRKKNEEWKAKIEKKKADDKQHQEKIEKTKTVGNIEGFVKATIQAFAKPFTANPIRHPMNPPSVAFKSAAIPKHMQKSLGKTGASSLPDIHEASDATQGPSTSAQNPLLKKSSPQQKAFGSVGQLPGPGVPNLKQQQGFPTKKSVYHPAQPLNLKSKPITPILHAKVPAASTLTGTKKPQPPVQQLYPFDMTENDDEGDSFMTADMTADLENEVISSYDITRYEDLDEENRHRENKPVPDWASNDEKLNTSLFYQQPEFLRLMRSTCFPAKNIGYRLFPNIRH